MKITILGAGAFGFAIAKVISENQRDITLFDINKEYINHIEKTKEHPIFHDDCKLPGHIKTTTNLMEAVSDAELIILAIPTKCFRKAIQEFKPYLADDVIFINLAKGLEYGTNMRISEIIEEELDIPHQTCVLSGGMIAREVTLQNPICADLACENRDTAKKVARLLWSDYFRVETNDDVIGVSLAGAFKNVIAIGAGIFDGLGYGESSKSAFISSTAQEMRDLAIAMGGKTDTFGPGTQAWFGDLMTTCFGASRNRELGELIGKGTGVQAALDMMVKANKSIEGYITTDVVHSLLKIHCITAPHLNEIHNVLYKGKQPKEFILDFIKT